MAGVKFPSSFDVTGRFPLDSKFWVASVTNLSDGEIYAGLHRWTLDTGKEYVYQQNNTWKDVSNGDKGDSGTVTIGYVTTGAEAAVVNRGTISAAILDITIPKGDAGSTPIIDIGTTTAGITPSVTNVGTVDRAILNFVIPASTPGVNGLDGKSLWFAYADTATGTNPSFTASNKTYISITADYQQPPLNAFTSWIQVKGIDGAVGASAYIAYSAFADGAGASFIFNTIHKYISILVASTQPVLTAFTTWVLFKGLDGGPAGDSAYQTWLKLGNNGSTAVFINSLVGAAGLSAYQIWLALGNIGTQADYIRTTQSDVSKAYVDSATSAITTSLAASNAQISTNTTNIAANSVAILFNLSNNNNALNNKVDKVTGKSLILDTEVTRLAAITGTNTGDNATNTQYSGLATSKQDTLVSGTNIKSINGASILGAGNLTVTGITAETLAATITAATSKPTPVDADEIGITDSATSFSLKKLTWLNLKITLKAYFDTIYTTTSAVGTQITTALTGYATQTFVTGQGYITNVVTALGYTPENTANKSTVITDSASTVKFPVWNAVVAYFDITRIKGILGISILSGSNTGDQTITLTGDVTGTGTSSFITTLANTTVVAGSYTNTSITVNAKGLLTSVTSGSGGSVGSVTSTSVVSANGISGSVATATTTPAITLTLGAITPTSVASTGAVSGTNLSGVNTGDETTLRINNLYGYVPVNPIVFKTYVDTLEYGAYYDVTHTYLDTCTLTELRKSAGITGITYSKNTAGFVGIATGVNSLLLTAGDLVVWRITGYNPTYTSGTLQFKIVLQ